MYVIDQLNEVCLRDLLNLIKVYMEVLSNLIKATISEEMEIFKSRFFCPIETNSSRGQNEHVSNFDQLFSFV